MDRETTTKKMTMVILTMLIMAFVTTVSAFAGTKEQAGSILREGMKARMATITIADIPTSETGSTIYAEAVKHTGKGSEGDYLNWSVDKWNSRKVTRKGVSTITFNVKYNDTPAQEKEVAKALDRKKYSGSAYKKIKKIYKYAVTHCKYAKNSKNVSFTAYGHLKGRAYCQGYALVLYRLMNNNGIPCRIITGTSVNSSGKKEDHAWNAIKYKNKWYYMDSTWDSCLENRSVKTYAYFMKNASTFLKDHTPSDDDGYSLTLAKKIKLYSRTKKNTKKTKKGKKHKR